MKNKYSNYFFLVLFAILLFISYNLIKPFLTAILASMLFTYLFYPIYKKMNLIIKNKSLCSIIFILILTSIIIVSIYFLTNALVNELVTSYNYIKNINLDVVNEFITKYTKDIINIDIKYIINKAFDLLLDPLLSLAISVPERIVSFIIIIFTMYYFLQEGGEIAKKFRRVIPLKENHKNVLAKKFHETVYATFYGIIITGIIQGIVGAIGLIIFKVQSPIVWGIVMIIFAILPYVGPSFVWLPISLYKVFTGDLFNGIGLLIYSILITSTVDNFIRPHLISKKSNVHPILILLGIIGGLKMFGFVGIIIGPIILTIFSTLFDFYVMKYGTKS